MVDAVVTNLVANLITGAIFGGVGLLLAVLTPFWARLWIELWCRLRPASAAALRAHFADEMAANKRLVRIARAIGFVVAVPEIAFALEEAECSEHATKPAPVIGRIIELREVSSGGSTASAHLTVTPEPVIIRTRISAALRALAALDHACQHDRRVA